MKKIILFLTASIIAFSAEAQFNILNKVKDKADQRVNNKIDNGIDKGMDKTEQGVKDGSKKKDDSSKPNADNKDGGKTDQKNSADAKQPSLASYGKYDFVPGAHVIFEDNLADEKLGEFPSKWDLLNGKIEIAKLGDENVIAFLDGNYASIVPLMKDAEKDYLPEVFSIEFDLYCTQGGYTSMEVSLSDHKNQKWEESNSEMNGWYINIGNEAKIETASGTYSEENYTNRWHHCAIAFNKGNVKLYEDQYRLANLPRAKGDPMGMSLGCIGSEKEPLYIKNIRIAEGGGDLYKRVTTDGKFVTHGILFDVNKATIKAQSMGALNEIYSMMKDHADLKFEIDGHTDADGDDASNLKLSQSRADAVKTQLVSMGIDASRMNTKGFGESKPVSDNSSPEGKANNRRVEFVKL